MFALSGMDVVDSGQVIFDGVALSTLGENELADMRQKEYGLRFSTADTAQESEHPRQYHSPIHA